MPWITGHIPFFPIPVSTQVIQCVRQGSIMPNQIHPVARRFYCTLHLKQVIFGKRQEQICLKDQTSLECETDT